MNADARRYLRKVLSVFICVYPWQASRWMTTFTFAPWPPTGKLRTGTIHGESRTSLVARELRRQGLTPVYVGLEAEENAVELKLPAFAGGKQRDVLFFTQELSTLLNAGVPLDRALSHHRRADRARLVPRRWCSTSCACSRAANRWPTAWPRIRRIFPSCTSTWCARAKLRGSLAHDLRAALRIRAHARRSARLHHLSSMIYPALLTLVGIGSIFMLLNFVVPRFARSSPIRA